MWGKPLFLYTILQKSPTSYLYTFTALTQINFTSQTKWEDIYQMFETCYITTNQLFGASIRYSHVTNLHLAVFFFSFVWSSCDQVRRPPHQSSLYSANMSTNVLKWKPNKFDAQRERERGGGPVGDGRWASCERHCEERGGVWRGEWEAKQQVVSLKRGITSGNINKSSISFI